MNKAIFLDRDGVINESHTDRVKFVNKPDDLYLLPGVADAIAMLKKAGYKIFVVTNQGGVAYGLMSEETLDAIHQRMEELLLLGNPNALIDEIVYCPHHPKKDNCSCRKPKPGMITNLAKRYNIDLSQSWMVGDMETDIQAGESAGCQSYLVDKAHSLLDFANHVKSFTLSVYRK